MAIWETTRTWGEMVKFSHSFFALPFAVMAAFLAGRHLPGGVPYWGQLALIVVCMVGARSMAMTFNRIADVALDARNPRTSDRALPAGKIDLRAAWVFFALCFFLFLAGCLGFVVFYENFWPILLAIPVSVFLCGYSYTKRFTRWSHYYLGAALAVSPLAAWLAVDPGSLGLSACILAGAVTLWIGGFDVIYACQDIEFDRRAGLHSLPASLSPRSALWIARLSHAGVIGLLVYLGILSQLGAWYWPGVVAVAVLLCVENAMVRPNDFSRVNRIFFTVNGLVGLVLASVTVMDIIF